MLAQDDGDNDATLGVIYVEEQYKMDGKNSGE